MTSPTLDYVLDCPRLPVLPPASVELMELNVDPDVDPSDVDALLKQSPTLAEQILGAVNSRHFSPQEPCTTIERAVSYVGVSTISSLAAGFSLIEVTAAYEQDIDLLEFWRRGLVSAAAARYVAVATQGCNPQDAFIAALLQDIGMLALQAALGDAYRDVQARAGTCHRVLPRRERTALGVTHAEAGAGLGRRWNLPDRFLEPILRHHHRHARAGVHYPIVNAVVLGCHISHLCLGRMRESDVARAGAMSRRFFGLSSADARVLLAGATRDASALAGGLIVHGDRVPDAGAVMARAGDALIAHHCLQIEQGASLKPLESALAAAAAPDGVGDRIGFDRELAFRFAQARARGECLGLALIDVDAFAALRRDRGPKAANRMLAAVAETLREGSTDGPDVALYEPGTLALIVPGASRFDAAKLAEHRRNAIEQQQIDLGGADGHTRVTATIGVAALDPGTADKLADPAALLHLADGALRAARAAGRNCVRVFSPRHGHSRAA